jgi:glycerol-3-phosphate cytidylyltransferase
VPILQFDIQEERTPLIRIGYAPGAFDLFHIGHLNLLRRAKEHCDYLVAGVVADEVLIKHKGVTPVVSLAERLEIVRNVRFVNAAVPALTNDKVAIWQDLRFNVLFKGNDWQGTEKGNRLEREFAALGGGCVFSLHRFNVKQRTSTHIAEHRRLGRPRESVGDPRTCRVTCVGARNRSLA